MNFFNTDLIELLTKTREEHPELWSVECLDLVAEDLRYFYSLETRDSQRRPPRGREGDAPQSRYRIIDRQE